MKKILANLLFLLSALILLFLAGEAVARLFLPAGDYLQPEIIVDRWGLRIKPGAVGHDEWGFRNRGVPGRAEIVAIGDSHTYGFAAVGSDAWPAVLEKLTGRTVYNLGMPGYDPLGYEHLLHRRGFQLQPSLVLVGFYLGNDVTGAYRTFSRLRGRGEGSDEDPVSGLVPDSSGSPLFRAKRWLSRHSMLYNVIRYSGTVRLVYDRLFPGGQGEGVEVRVAGENIRTVLLPRGLRSVDLDLIPVREGLRISLETIAKMDKACRRMGIALAVVLIPSKVAVYSDLSPVDCPGEEARRLRDWIGKERQMNGLVREYLDAHAIPWLDVLPPLRATARSEQVYSRGADTHPNREGYLVIARSLAEWLEERDPERER